jgi:hypothetical protein
MLLSRARRRWPRLNLTDLLLVAALALWGIGVARANPDAVDQYGLLPAVPIVYFAGFAVILVSVGILLARNELSGPRLALHLVALIVMIHATAPLIYAEPRYAWTYKHIGVVNYINANGRLDSSVDIYNNWPGFFAVAAWFGRIAGIESPLAYAAWAQLFFNLLTTLELAFAARALPLTDRERWLALFLFVAGNWVGQDYFAPQAMSFVLSLGVLALILHWFHGDRLPAWIAKLSRGRTRPRWFRRPEREPDHPAPRIGVSRLGAVAVLLGIYLVLVFTHELSPYVVALQVSALLVVGGVRPWWVVLAMWGLCLAYLMPRFTIINSTYHITTALTNPFFNLLHATKDYPPGLPGRRLAASAARALALSIWALGLLGAGRRLWEGRRTLPLLSLAFSPMLVIFAHSYGGEALYRVYLFSLPWAACLVASLIRPEAISAAGLSWLLPHVSLLATIGLFIPAFFGLDMVTVMPPAEVRASAYFYAHAEPGSVLLGTPNFPTRPASNYNEFIMNPNSTDPTFLDRRLWGRVLGVADLPILANKMQAYEDEGATAGYLVLSTSQANAATWFGVLPQGSIQSLEQALLNSRDWTVFYRDPDTIIFEFAQPPTSSDDRG